jgi:hypothetical protein
MPREGNHFGGPWDGGVQAAPFASFLAGGQASQRGKETASLGSVGAIPADPASHPYQFARRHVLAIVEMLAYRDRVPETCYLAYCDCSRIETMPVTGAFARSLSP